jgi:peptide/nickel transport system substrate-binding protein
MKTKRLLALLLASLMIFAFVAACSGEEDPVDPVTDPTPTDAGTTDPTQTDPVDPPPAAYGRDPYVAPEISASIPRNETLYFAGLQWSPVNGWNPHMQNANNAVANDQNGGGSSTVMWETPYMYNGLDGQMYPLLADGPYDWNPATGQMRYRIKPAAFWSDGTKVTAHDAAFTWEFGINYSANGNENWTPFIESVTAESDDTVLIQAAMVDGAPANSFMVIEFIGTNYILQKAWQERMIERNDGDIASIGADDSRGDIVWSGPYTRYFEDDTRVILIRDDGYWGQHSSMWNKLPTPKFLAQIFYADNAAADAAFAGGEVDVSQGFIANVHLLWEEQGLPISTFIDRPPFGLCVNMPTAWYNMNVPILADNVELRQAIAWAVDYDAINANAMTGQSPTFAAIPRSLMNPTPGEQALYNRDAVAHLQWAGNDIDAANALLDESGKFPMGADGWRTYNGEKISLIASCPYGWSDWEASMEIVAAAGALIGIEITTFFPDWSIYQTVVTAAYHDEYDIFMMWTASVSPSQPWGRIRNILSSEFVGMAHNWTGNWGHYSNARADELIAAIPRETNQARVIDMYTELVELYLTEVPSFSLMYRPDKFHTVNESVWTGYTTQGDGRNVPPFNCIFGYAIADLYNLRLVG